MIRKQLRIKDYDYSQEGIYFITICSFQKENIFCKIDNKIQLVKYNDIDFEEYINLTNIGVIIKDAINNIDKIYQNVNVIKYIIMPNHIHILIEFIDTPQNSHGRKDLSKIIGGLKRYVSKEFNQDKTNKIEIWQKSYYEHIIRNEKEFNEILEYIIYNPLKWELDEYHIMGG